MTLPNDPFILLSYVNTQLRDYYCDLDELCGSLEIDKARLEEKLSSIDYVYDKVQNRFL